MTDVFDLAAMTVDGALGYSLSVSEVLTRVDTGNHRGSLHPRATYDLNESKFDTPHPFAPHPFAPHPFALHPFAPHPALHPMSRSNGL